MEKSSVSMTTGPSWAVEPALVLLLPVFTSDAVVQCAAWTQWLRKANISLSLTEVKVFLPLLSPWQQQPEHTGSWCGYLIGPDEGLHGQMILHQLLHVGLSSHQRGELRSSRQSQRRLVGGARRSTGIGVPEEHVPGLAGREEARRKRRGEERQERGSGRKTTASGPDQTGSRRHQLDGGPTATAKVPVGTGTNLVLSTT